MNTRQTYLDWLRIMAIIGMLFFHSAMAFVAEEGWHIKNHETSNLLLEFNFWLSRFRMPLLFFISGAVAWWIMRGKTTLSFIGLRFRRLFLPLVAGMLVVVPPQVYLERLTQGYQGNFFDFYPSIFSFKPYPEGNFSWHHLWFIAYLLVYDVLLAPLFSWGKSPAGRRFLEQLGTLAGGKGVYLLTLPGILLHARYCIAYGQTNDLLHDPLYFFYWLWFLLVGYLCMASPDLLESLERNRRLSLTVAFLSFVAINYFRWNNREPFDVLPDWRTDGRTYLYFSLYSITAWSWVFAAVGYGKKVLKQTPAGFALPQPGRLSLLHSPPNRHSPRRILRRPYFGHGAAKVFVYGSFLPGYQYAGVPHPHPAFCPYAFHVWDEVRGGFPAHPQKAGEKSSGGRGGYGVSS